jgi:hypothetical protein
MLGWRALEYSKYFTHTPCFYNGSILHLQLLQRTDGWQGAHQRKKLKIDRVIKNHKINLIRLPS